MTHLQVILAAAGTLVVTILAIFGFGRREGRKAEQQRQQKATVDAYETRAEVEDDVAGMGDVGMRDRLRDRWMRRDGDA